MPQCVVYHLLHTLAYPGVAAMEEVTPLSSPKVKKLHVRKVQCKRMPPLPSTNPTGTQVAAYTMLVKRVGMYLRDTSPDT
jgi:hypothetical protein